MKKEFIDKKSLFIAGIVIIFLFQAWWIYGNVVFQLSGGAEWPPREGTRIPEVKPVTAATAQPGSSAAAPSQALPTPVLLTASPQAAGGQTPATAPGLPSATQPGNGAAAPGGQVARAPGNSVSPPKPVGGIILSDYLAGIYNMEADPSLALSASQAKALTPLVEKLALNSQTATALENMLVALYNSNQLQYIANNFDSLSQGLKLEASAGDEKEATLSTAIKLLQGKLGGSAPEALPAVKNYSLPAGQRPLTFRDHSAAIIKLEQFPANAITPEQARKMLPILKAGLKYVQDERAIGAAFKSQFNSRQLAYIETKRFEFVKNPPPRVSDMDPLVYAALQTLKKHSK